MSKYPVFIERRAEGDYAIRKGGAQRASAVEPTKAEAMERARRMSPDAPPHVERVRDTSKGARDKWRKALIDGDRFVGQSTASCRQYRPLSIAKDVDVCLVIRHSACKIRVFQQGSGNRAKSGMD